MATISRSSARPARTGCSTSGTWRASCRAASSASSCAAATAGGPCTARPPPSRPTRTGAISSSSTNTSTATTALASAGVKIADALARAAVDGRTGGTGTVNVQGEAVKKLDLWANDAVRDALAATGAAYLLVSEEIEAPLELGGAGGYVVCFDPVDGSSNLDINGVVGTIFSIRARSGRGPEHDAMLPGTAQVAAGYLMYGP